MRKEETSNTTFKQDISKAEKSYNTKDMNLRAGYAVLCQILALSHRPRGINK